MNIHRNGFCIFEFYNETNMLNDVKFNRNGL
jgi:hypothetical protein